MSVDKERRVRNVIKNGNMKNKEIKMGWSETEMNGYGKGMNEGRKIECEERKMKETGDNEKEENDR